MTLSLSILFSQKRDSIPLDDRRVLFGFQLGTNQVVSTKSDLGLAFGSSVDIRLNKHIYLRLPLTLSFFTYKHTGTTVEKSFLDIPLHILYKPFAKKIRPIFNCGPNYRYDLDSSSSGWYIDAGIGLEIKFKYFLFSPDLKYSYTKDFSTASLTICFKA